MVPNGAFRSPPHSVRATIASYHQLTKELLHNQQHSYVNNHVANALSKITSHELLPMDYMTLTQHRRDLKTLAFDAGFKR